MRASDPPGGPVAEPRFDTFGLADTAGSWCVEPAAPPVARDAAPNERLAAALDASLDAFGDLVRAWRVDVLPDPDGPGRPLRLEQEPDEEPAAFLTRSRDAVAAFPAGIHAVEVTVDVFAYFRMAETPDRPVRACARLHDLFRVLAGEHPAVCFNLQHTLFAPYSPDGVDNAELHALNQPLLEAALRRWESRVGPITDVEGEFGVYRHGFRAQTESSS